MSETNTIDRWTKSALFLTLILLLFYFGGHILFPVLFAGFIALALSGIARRMDNWGINRFLSAFLLTLILSVIFMGIIAFLSLEGVRVADEIRAMSGSKTIDTVVSIFEMAKDKLELSSSVEDPISNWTGSILSSSGEVISAVIGGLQSTVIFFSLVPIYIFFMLAYRKVFARFLEAATVNKTEDTGKKIMEEITDMLRKYVNGLFIVILIVAALNTIGLWIIGVDHPLFFGTATALLMIIPYIGVFIGSIVPAAIALITLDSIWYPIAVISMYAFIQFIEGNYITPTIVGSSVNLNPLAIIIGMVVLGTVGGIVALIIAVPLIATAKILLHHSSYRSFAILFENEPDNKH